MLFKNTGSIHHFFFFKENGRNICPCVVKEKMFRICEFENTDGPRVTSIQMAYARKLVRGESVTLARQ